MSSTLIVRTAPARRIMVCQYLCIIYPVFVAPWFPRSVYALNAFRYIDVLTCAIYNLQRRLEPAVKIINEDRGRQMHIPMV